MAIRTAITAKYVTSVTLDVGSLTANTTTNVSFNVPRATPDDAIICIPPSTLDAGLSVPSCVCNIAGTVLARFNNSTVGPINPASLTYTFVAL